MWLILFNDAVSTVEFTSEDHNKWSVFKDIEKVDRGLFEDIRHQIVM
jgi:hypothetical protein